jgi:hypothetical protein
MKNNFQLNPDYKKTIYELIDLVKNKSDKSGWSYGLDDKCYVYYGEGKLEQRTPKKSIGYNRTPIKPYEFLQEIDNEISLKERIRKIKKIRNQLIRRKFEVIIPKNFMNVGVSTCNHLIADTNDSSNWDTLKFPLPEGKWHIYNVKGKIVTLITKENKYNKHSIPK